MKRLLAPCYCMLFVMLFLTNRSAAVPIQWTVASGGNGHYYDFTAGNVTWTDAETAAGSLSFAGLPGHLTTITSQGEQDFLLANFGSQTDLWIGASDAAAEGEWRWETGPEAGMLFWKGDQNGGSQAYENWRGGEPNNTSGSPPPLSEEDYGVWNASASSQWNDEYLGSAFVNGYLIEYSEPIEPVQWTVASGGNGHYYHVVIGNVSWTEAKNAAQALSFGGASGHLAAITSQAENDFVLSAYGELTNLWIGASDDEVEGEWRWQTGQEAGSLFWLGGSGGTALDYANWRAGEPNNHSGGIPGEENHAAWNWRGLGVWNDSNHDSIFVSGYVVEFPVPEPSSYILCLLLAMVAIPCARWRRRRAA